jgi:hypothetical protein
MKHILTCTIRHYRWTTHNLQKIGKMIFSIIIAILFFCQNSFAQQNKQHVFEIGLTYDQSFVNRFDQNNEEKAKEYLDTLLHNVNKLFVECGSLKPLQIQVKVNELRKVSGLNLSSNRAFITSVAHYWTHIEPCSHLDLAHHVTGLPSTHVGLGHAFTGGVCQLFPKSPASGASYTRIHNITYSSVKQHAYEMARLLLHQLGLSYDACSGMPFGSHCLMAQNYESTFTDQHAFSSLWLSNTTFQTLKNLLLKQDYACLLSENQFVFDSIRSDCQFCDGKVSLYSENAGYLNPIGEAMADGFPPEGINIDLNTTFKNSCDKRVVQAEIYYHDAHLSAIKLPEGFSEPKNITTNDYNKYVTSNPIEISEEKEHSVLAKLTFNGKTNYNIVAGQNGSAVRVRYQVVSGKPFVSGQTDATYRFLQPFYIDKRGNPKVFASQIKTPVSDQPYNFCSGITHYIYVDGDLIMDYDVRFCNTHFIMGKNSTIIVQDHKKVSFEDCIFRNEDPASKWNGIETGIDVVASFTGETKFIMAKTAIKAVDKNTVVHLKALPGEKKIEFIDCTIGIQTKNIKDLYIESVQFTGKGGYVSLDLWHTHTIIKNTFFNMNAGTTAIRAIGEGHLLSISDHCMFLNQLRSLYAKGVFLHIRNSSFDGGHAAISVFDTPNLSHEIKDVTISNTKESGISVFNSTSFVTGVKSVFEHNVLQNNRKNALSLTDTRTGWNIKSTFLNNKTSVYLSNASDNVVSGSIFSYDPTDGKHVGDIDFIHISSGENNVIGGSDTSANHFVFHNDQWSKTLFRHIFLNNSGSGNHILCNRFTGGNRGINPWGLSLTKIAGNHFFDVDRGLFFGLVAGDMVTTTGIQNNNNNSWHSTFKSNSIGAQHLGLNQDMVRQSQFLVHEKSNRFLPPFLAKDDTWFALSPDIPYSCGISDDEEPKPLQIISDAIENLKYFQHNDGMIQYLADVHIRENSDFFEKRASKATSGQEENILSFTKERSLIRQAEALLYQPASLQSMMEKSYLSINQHIQRMYADDITESEKDSILVDIRLLARNAQNHYAMYLRDLKKRSIKINEILQNVSSDQKYWSNKAVTLSVLCQKWTDTADSVSVDELQSIASQCPLEGGKGVYTARNILKNCFSDSLTYDDVVLCSREGFDRQFTETAEYSIFPNPATDYFTVLSAKNILFLEVSDYTGKQILVSFPETQEVKTDCSTWAPGMYIVRTLLQGEKEHTSHKVIIFP